MSDARYAEQFVLVINITKLLVLHRILVVPGLPVESVHERAFGELGTRAKTRSCYMKVLACGETLQLLKQQLQTAN